MGCIKYGLLVPKVCLSVRILRKQCLETQHLRQPVRADSLRILFRRIVWVKCYSFGIGFTPVDPSTGKIFTGKLRDHAGGHGLATDVNQGLLLTCGLIISPKYCTAAQRSHGKYV